MRMSTKWVLLFLIVVTGWSFGQPPPPAVVKAKETDGKSGEAGKRADVADKSLEALMAQALRNNPDVLAAESKVREAEAELRRTKLVLALKITEQQIAVENQRRIAASWQAEFEMYQNLVKHGAGSESDMRQAEQKMLLAKAQFASAEAALNTTAGILPKGIAALAGGSGPAGPIPTGDGINGGMHPWPSGGFSGLGGIGGISGITGNGGSITGGITGIGGGITGNGGGISGNLGMIGGNPGALGGPVPPDAPPVRVPSAPMADKVRRVLDVTIRVKPVKDKPLADVVKSFVPADGGVSLCVQLGDKEKVPVSLSLEGDVQLGAVFQALEDVVPGLKCYVREYGIMVTTDENPMEGAMPLVDFWQRKPGAR
jgi:hypothetical protein